MCYKVFFSLFSRFREFLRKFSLLPVFFSKQFEPHNLLITANVVY